VQTEKHYTQHATICGGTIISCWWASGLVPEDYDVRSCLWEQERAVTLTCIFKIIKH